jgi:uncharacterized damage-inducible protein DinB
MTATDRLIDQLTRAYDGEPWHDAPLKLLVADVTAAEAAARPIGRAHNIFELALHLAGWKREVAARLRGQPAGAPPQGDWPAVPADLEAGWREVRAALEDAHRELVAEVRRLGDAGLDRLTRDTRPDVTTPDTGWQAAMGILQHDAYHAGQIGLLKRALRG